MLDFGVLKNKRKTQNKQTNQMGLRLILAQFRVVLERFWSPFPEFFSIYYFMGWI